MPTNIAMNRVPTAARWTPPGRGAIAVIRVEHASADWMNDAEPVFRSHREQPWSALPVGRLIYGRWGHSSPEDVVVCRLTHTDFEVHCHGGDAAVVRILGDLADLGIVAVTAEEQRITHLGVIQAELETAVTQALTVRTADLLLQQADGRWPAALKRWGLSWFREGEAPAEPLRGNTLESARGSAGASPSHRTEVAAALAWADFARHLVEPWNVVLTGRPNVGKSSLINALLGYQRAIVNPQPGTTRDVVTAVTAFEGWPVRLSDTAGLRDTADDLEAAGIARARQHLADADAIVIVLDIHQPPTDDDFALLAAHPDALVIAHKCDLPNQWGAALPSHALAVSSVTKVGLEELQAALVRKLIPHEPPAEALLPVTDRLRSLVSA
ncbi:MAG TPA: GTPase [Planctomycetaceae bacterium]|nr:GTPase [Planctomycetaceae bacterium]